MCVLGHDTPCIAGHLKGWLSVEVIERRSPSDLHTLSRQHIDRSSSHILGDITSHLVSTLEKDHTSNAKDHCNTCSYQGDASLVPVGYLRGVVEEQRPEDVKRNS